MSRWMILILLIMIPLTANAQNVITVTDEDIVGDVFWTADNTYVLNGRVFVEDGETLTIEAGTVVKGKPGQGEDASALIVARGGQIFAEGTPTNPIIFTAEADDVTDPNDLPLNARGLWGGVIILGRATINVSGGEENIEGIPTTETRAIYGGNDDDDNSGVFRYVSIRYGGTNIGANNEINSLTMGAVGRGTTIEFVESFNNADDGYEWFGGTVNTRYLVSAFNEDDGFDYDEGWRGKNQFWFLIQAEDAGGSGGEHDGGTTPEDGQPFSIPEVYNATYIGSGASSTNSRNDFALNIRDNAGGMYFNSIFTDFFGSAVQVEDLASGEDSRARLEAGDLELQYNIWHNFGAGATPDEFFPQDFVRSYISDAANTNRFEDPQLRGISRTTDGGLDPRPADGSPAFSNVKQVPDDGFFAQTDYVGAFGSNGLWIDGWTFISELGVVRPRGVNVITVTDEDIVGDVFWTADNTYVLNGRVFVEDGETLTIEAGTVVKGKPGQGEDASALIVARGGQIFAEGTPTNPIIFTAEADDVTDPNDLPLNARGLWGGVIILGRATINVSGGEENIEGIPTTETRAIYGGNDDDDNSGVFRYVSIRYGGTNIGANNEINSLTMGAVGRGTTIEFVESFNNADDGYEWFGGTVNTRYLVSAFNEDDGFDYDEGWRGKNQFWFLIQAEDAGGSGGEHDGGTTPEDGQPFSIPEVYNATYIGSGASSTNSRNDFALNIRDNAGGMYFNSIFTDFFGSAVQVEDLASGEDSRARLEAGDLELQYNIWHNFGAGATPDEFFPQDFVRSYISDAANTNRFEDPQLRGISRTTDGGLDPRPADGSPAFSNVKQVPDDGFFAQTDYVGAFGEQNWAADWTVISELRVLNSLGAGTPEVVTSVEGHRNETSAVPEDFLLSQNYPNPFNPTTNINFSIPASGQVKLTVFNVLGQQVATLVDGSKPAGNYTVTWDAHSFSSGMYFYVIETGSAKMVRKMMLMK